MQSKNMNTALLAAALVMPSASVFADNNSHSTTAPQAKEKPFTTVYFAPRTQYRTASERFLQRFIDTSHINGHRIIGANIYGTGGIKNLTHKFDRAVIRYRM